MDQGHMHMCHRAVAWTSDVTYMLATGWRELTPKRWVVRQRTSKNFEKKPFSLALSYKFSLATTVFSHFETPLNPFSATRRYKRHQNKVMVKGLGRKSSYLDGFSVFFMVL